MAKFFRNISRQQPALASMSVVAAIILLAYGSWGLWQYYQAIYNRPEKIAQKVITHSTDMPSETKPTEACMHYKTAGNHPERISIPSIGVSGCITKVGIDQHGAIASPDNIYTAAWYVKSALPGQPGLSIIDGHVSGRFRQDGIFQYLNQLKNGDAFSITLGSGKVLDYQVVEAKTIPLERAASALLAKDPTIVSQLNLVTCGGHYDKVTKLYDRRVIVSAKLL